MKILIFLLLLPSLAMGGVLGDLNKDDKVGLEDVAIAIQTVAGFTESEATLFHAIYGLQTISGIIANPLFFYGDSPVFSKDWLIGKVLYNTTWDYDTSEFIIYTFRFDENLQKLWFKAGIETPTTEDNETSYSILSDGILRFVPDGYPTQYLAIISYSQDWIQVAWRDNLDELREELEDADDEEYFFFNKNKAIRFIIE